MNLDQPTPLLAGLSPARFMQRHWQKKPLLVRQAWPGVVPPLDRAALFALAGDEQVESRLVSRREGQWQLRQGPFSRRQLPPVSRADWTLLVQGLDIHVPAAQQMLSAFRFLPGVRLDDLMLSWASDGGGVGPHLDSYDVFLLQVQGRRRWRIGPVANKRLVDGLPVRILADFLPKQEWLLEPGDMLYLPPKWGHDGVAEGECMTCSIGFRSPGADDLAQELLQQLSLELTLQSEERGREQTRYRDPSQAATTCPGAVPPGLRQFAQDALARALRDTAALDRALGCLLTEPKPKVWFSPGSLPAPGEGLRLDARSRMAYDDGHVYLNGEAFAAGGRDATLVRRLADQQVLAATDLARLSGPAKALLLDWCDAGWLRPDPMPAPTRPVTSPAPAVPRVGAKRLQAVPR